MEGFTSSGLAAAGEAMDLLISMEVNATAPAPTESEAGEPQVAILFIGVSLFLGMASRHLLGGTVIPYTVALLLLGIALGGLEYGTTNGLGVLGDSIRMWANIDPNLILFVFLPALLFESSFAMDFHQIKRSFMQMFLLAAPGVVISTFFLGVVMVKMFPYDWDWSTGLLLGGLLSATDPVAVVALLKELGASKKLSTLIEGESLMNDGTAIVVFRLFLRMVLGQQFSAGDVISFLCRVALGALALGVLFGIVSVFWVGLVFNDTIIEITLTLTASYMAFFVAEQNAHVSGVLTVMTVGIFFAAFARTAFTGESEQSMFHFWEIISYIANTLIFLLSHFEHHKLQHDQHHHVYADFGGPSGVVIAESILRSKDKIEGRDWSYLLLLYVFVQLSRVVVVGALYPSLKYFGYGINWKEAVLLVWAGLRGAVALSLSLSVAHEGDHESHVHLTRLTEARFVFLTGGVVFLTLIINGSTTQFLLHHLNMNTITETKARVLEFAKFDMHSKALEAFGELGEDEELGPADWTTIRKYVSCLKDLPENGRPAHPHGPPSSEAAAEPEHVQQQMLDTRVRFLNGVQAAYWSMLEEGRITQTAALLLMQSVDEALDQVENHSKLQDYESLRPHVQLPTFLKYLSWRSTSFLPRRVITFLLVQRLDLACYIAAAFLRAHRMTRNHLRDFIGESEVAEAVIEESESQGAEAREFLEQIRLSFPQVLRAVKTKQVTHAILLHLTEYVRSLEIGGLLESKETHQLHDAVQVDLKKLLRNPPIVEMPTVQETLHNQPFFGALPDSVQVPLLVAAKEHMKVKGTILYEEEVKPDGIWLIANGVVKWSSMATSGQRLRQATFSYGTTLGLYETLTGKPYLCDITTDSVVHCFFIERSRILAVQKGNPELEEFLWQECALAVSKIVLAPQFEKVTLQEMRALVMDGSSMRIFLRGEVFELRHGEIGVLLEGFVRQDKNTEIITAPAGLMLKTPLPSPADSQRNVNFQEVAVFHADARCRVLFFDMVLSNQILSQSTGQLLPSARKASRPTLRSSMIDHDLASMWPSSRRVSRISSVDAMSNMDNNIAAGSASSIPFAWGNTDITNNIVPDRYSAKALEISVYGSQVNDDGMPEDGQIRVIQSHSNLVNRMSMFMLDRPEAGDAVKERVRRRKVSSSHGDLGQGDSSHGDLGLSLPLVPHETTSGESSEDKEENVSDKEEHVVKIDSPSALFHASKPEHTSRD